MLPVICVYALPCGNFETWKYCSLYELRNERDVCSVDELDSYFVTLVGILEWRLMILMVFTVGLI